MKITQIEALPLDIPYIEDLNASFMTYTGINNVLVRVRTDAGLVGYGEANPLPGTLAIRPRA